MKNITNALRLLILTASMAMSASVAQAGPGIQQWKTLGNESDFNNLKAGSAVAYVCNTCKTISEMEIKSTESAMELCKEGGHVSCPSCKQVTKVVVKRARNDAPTHKEISYVNDKGEACAFIAHVEKK
jgi:phage FluMu protein Com